MSKLWGGRFSKDTHAWVDEFTSSLAVDQRLWEADLAGSIAHAKMLGRQKILPAAESGQIVKGLEEVGKLLGTGELKFDPRAEDVHSELERMLREKIGPVAGKLHTARSRNDQVATAFRLYLRGEVDLFVGELKTLQTWIVVEAPKHLEHLLPGMTHTQHGQPVSLAHHLMAYFWMFARDRERLTQLRTRINRLPLGSAALAGTSFPIDRQSVAKELGFEGVCENSLDAVSDRDFAVELGAACSLVMTHLSRLSEELILWSAPEFGFVELDDSVTTGSSIMPQKKNPDVAELIRGKVGRVHGDLLGLLTTLKALPLAYNRDLQEDKEAIFDAVDTARASTRLMGLMLEGACFKTDRMRAALAGDLSNATDLADFLAAKGVPFRDAHEITGAVVKHCLSSARRLEDLTLADLQPFSKVFDESVLPRLKHEAVAHARTSEGGTGKSAVERQIELAKKAL